MTFGPRALYLCYFGLREPLVQNQVLPYLREIAGGGTRMSLLTFEPELKRRWTASELADWRERLRGEGIDWHVLPYHKRPSLPATLYDIVRGAIRAARLVRREGIGILHARSHVAAAMGVLAKQFTSARLIFDFRGFLADEYVESGNWRRNGLLFRLTKAAERWLLRSSDGFVVLTRRVQARLFSQDDRPVAVVPCCVDETRFGGGDRDALRSGLGLTGRTVLVYVGTLGGFYMTAETAELFSVVHESDPDAYLLCVTRSEPGPMVAHMDRLGVPSSAYRVVPGEVEDIPGYLRAADVALMLIQPSMAREASSPTKFAEYLAAGLPVISTRGVGDLDAEIEENRIGVLLAGQDRDSLARTWAKVIELRDDPSLPVRCREHARQRYSLRAVAGEGYRRLYREVLERR